MALAGIVLRSTAADTPEAEDSLTQRRPSTSTSVRLALRLRSDSVDEPEPTPLPSGAKPKLPAELNLVFNEEPLTDSSCRMSPIDLRPLAAICSCEMICTGESVVESDLRTREPSTCTPCREVTPGSVSANAGVAAGTAS